MFAALSAGGTKALMSLMHDPICERCERVLRMEPITAASVMWEVEVNRIRSLVQARM